MESETGLQSLALDGLDVHEDVFTLHVALQESVLVQFEQLHVNDAVFQFNAELKLDVVAQYKHWPATLQLPAQRFISQLTIFNLYKTSQTGSLSLTKYGHFKVTVPFVLL